MKENTDQFGKAVSKVAPERVLENLRHDLARCKEGQERGDPWVGLYGYLERSVEWAIADLSGEPVAPLDA